MMLGWFRNEISMFGWVSWKQNYDNLPWLYSIRTATNFDYHVPMCSILSYMFLIVLWFSSLPPWLFGRSLWMTTSLWMSCAKWSGTSVLGGQEILQDVGGIVLFWVGIWKFVIWLFFWGDYSFIIYRDLWPDLKIQAGGDRYFAQIYVSCRRRWWEWILTR